MAVNRRRIGDRDVHPVGLGCMNITHAYGPPLNEADAKALLARALDLGCDFLDTATIYGLGRSEELIGEALGQRRKEYFLASKCVLGFRDGQRVLDGRPEAIKAACEASLERLRTDVIDLYYLHRPDPKVPVEDSAGALADLVREGKIRFIGLSEMGEDQLRRAHKVHPVAALHPSKKPAITGGLLLCRKSKVVRPGWGSARAVRAYCPRSTCEQVFGSCHRRNT